MKYLDQKYCAIIRIKDSFLDPDAPSRLNPTNREIRHWLTVNIPGSDLSAGETFADYRGSMPPLGTGLHRYIFLLFKQSKGRTVFDLPIMSNETSTSRALTSTRDLMNEYNLELFGGNFFQAENEGNIPS